MKFLERTFLYQLFTTDKWLLGIVCLYGLGLLAAAATRTEQFPFLLFGMYSTREAAQPAYTTYAITVDGIELDYQSIFDVQREVITSPLEHAIDLYSQGKFTGQDMELLKAWLFRYLADMRTIENNQMQIDKIECAYTAAGKVKVVNRQTVLKYVAD